MDSDAKEEDWKWLQLTTKKRKLIREEVREGKQKGRDRLAMKNERSEGNLEKWTPFAFFRRRIEGIAVESTQLPSRKSVLRSVRVFVENFSTCYVFLPTKEIFHSKREVVSLSLTSFHQFFLIIPFLSHFSLIFIVMFPAKLFTLPIEISMVTFQWSIDI